MCIDSCVFHVIKKFGVDTVLTLPASCAQGREIECDGKTFLDQQISISEQKDEHMLDLPTNAEGNPMEISFLKVDQREVMAYVLKAIKAWVEYDPIKEDGTPNQPFQGIRLTVRGSAGCGKSVLLKTIVSVIRKMFQSRTAALIGGPTGASSFNVGGVTNHVLFGINPKSLDSPDVTPSKLEPLKYKFADTVVVCFDERSMVSSKMLGKMEATARQVAHNGYHTFEDWGNIPLIIFFGDDNQLPSYDKGTTFLPLGDVKIQPAPEYNRMAVRGQQLFMESARDVMDLPSIKRQNEAEGQFRDMLARARHDELTGDDVDAFKKLNIHSDNFTAEERREIMKDALFVFANKEPVKAHNISMMRTVASSMNPVARVRVQASTSLPLKRPIGRHFSNTKIPNLTVLCRNAKVRTFVATCVLL
jgi:ABC-type dipeptide/oligopeptide/nickel transport system ATPase component